MSELEIIVAGLLVSQVAGAVVLVAVLKNELRWVKDIARDHENRLRVIEGNRHAPVEFSELGV